MTTGILPLLGVSFSLGLAHAFDADHLAAVSSLAATRPGWKRAIRDAVHWAVGHGIALVSLGTLILATPLGGVLHGEAADRIVGVALVLLGLWTACSSYLHSGNASAHRHETRPWRRTTASVIGLLHGTAGVGAAVGLLGLARNSVAVGVANLLAFSVGVFAAMFVLAMAMGSFAHELGVRTTQRHLLPTLVGGMTTIIGLTMLR